MVASSPLVARPSPRRRAVATLTALALAAVGVAPESYACTAFAAGDGAHRLVAQSFDWNNGRGLMVENPRGRVRSAIYAPELRWTARFGSLSLTTLGPGLPVTGMNEAGLTVEALVDMSAPLSFSPPPSLTVLEWSQRALDLFDRVGDAVRDVRSRPLGQVGVALHLMVCDATPACAVIETNKKQQVVVVTGKNMPVAALANRPYRTDLARSAGTFAQHFERFVEPSGLSWPRFATVRANLDGSVPDGADDALDLLASVRIPGMTAWQVVWDVAARKLVWRDRQHEREAVEVKLSDYAFACAARDLVLDIGLPEKAPPKPAHRFTPADEDGAASRLARSILSFGDGNARDIAKAARHALRAEGCADPATLAREAPTPRRTGTK
jgi:hypothetical protein